MKLTIYFLLFSVSVVAQNPNIAYQRIVNEINRVLCQTKNIQYINPDKAIFNLRKIQSNPKGDVFLVDSLSNEDTKPHYSMFNVLKVKEFVSKGNKIQVINKNNQRIGTFTNVKKQDRYEFVKNFSALQHICDMYAKEDPKYKCTDGF